METLESFEKKGHEMFAGAGGDMLIRTIVSSRSNHKRKIHYWQRDLINLHSYPQLFRRTTR